MTETTKKEAKTTRTTSKKKASELEFKNIYDLLLYAQKNIKITKDIDNEYGGFLYYKVDQILNELKALFLKNGAFTRFAQDIVQVGERYYVEVVIKVDFNGEHFEESAKSREPLTKGKMDDSQVTRSATTQAKKTLLENILLISDGFDPDGANNNDYEHLTEDDLRKKHQQDVEQVKSFIPKIQKNYTVEESIVQSWLEMAEEKPELVYNQMSEYVKRARQMQAQEQQ